MIKNKVAIFIGVIAGLLNGFFGAGGGTVLVPMLEKGMDIPPHKAHATAIAIILPFTLMSIFFYMKSGAIDWQIAGQCSLGGIIGGFVGAKTLKHIPTLWLHRIFGAFMIIAAVRMLF
ncbi:MAG: sulfite exporter TauE/SafE family protein [Hyphomonadaceae bacterium]|nr:sulfite exporter TauE/SafE family protein [Clostridia bacterium]